MKGVPVKLMDTKSANTSRQRALSLDPVTLKMATLKLKSANTLDLTEYQRTRKNLKLMSLNPESKRRTEQIGNWSLSARPSRTSNYQHSVVSSSVSLAKKSGSRRRDSRSKADGRKVSISATVGYRRMSIPRKWLQEFDLKQREEIRSKRRKIKPLERFRHAVKLIQTLNRAFKSICSYAAEKGHHEQVSSEAALSLKGSAKSTIANLMFDPADYKCHYQFTFPKWAKEIAIKEPNQRTEEDVRALVRLLKHLKGFRKYSPQIQRELCKALRYDSFGRRRVVIRKGQVAQRFYLIFSGSVCVTISDDEQTAVLNKPAENTVLRRGDFFGELAFIRNLTRSATVVCLETTELLSVEKEDFFETKIDKCVEKDMERRMQFLSHHPIFSTWEKHFLRQVADASRLHEYKSEEVVVRDSVTSQWVIFIVKGQCDVVRLLDLSNCDEYVDHAAMYRTERILDTTQPHHLSNPTAERFSPSSVVKRGNFLEPRNSKEHILSATSEPKLSSREKTGSDLESQNRKIKSATTHAARLLKTSSAGYYNTHVEFNEPKPTEPSSLASDVQKKPSTIFEQDERRDSSREIGNEAPNMKVGVGVYMRVDRLHPGQCFGTWSLLEYEESRSNRDESPKKRKERRFTLTSRGCEVVKVAKEILRKHGDLTTMNYLKQFTKTYPKDNELCHAYIKQSDWRTYREELVDNVVVRHIVHHETAKGSARAHGVRSSPVSSPLCTLTCSNDDNQWELFPRSGWMAGRDLRTADEECSLRSSPQVSTPSTKPQSPPGHSNYSTPKPRAWKATCAKPAMIIPKSPDERILPLVKNELVLAEGSQRTLVLTQGGGRCNDYQLQVERRILKNANNQSKVTGRRRLKTV